MEKLSHAASRRMYSWWWDSHISPKNSKWLQENLTDMDAKVKSMIKLIEQDADSFARRAEMYYEKRPELMKMVEEFYRAYRALAERYDHATGALRQAHQTMTQAFPNGDDELVTDADENDPQTPDDDSFGSGYDLKFGEQEMNGEVKEKEQKHDMEIQELKKVLANFEVEKESSLAQYKQSLETIFHQEIEFSSAKEDSKELVERANKAEDEMKSLRKALKALEGEREKSLVQYQKCLKKIEYINGVISSTQKDVFDLNEQAQKAETEARTLKLELVSMESKKAAFLEQCEQTLEKLNKIVEEAETKSDTLKQALVELGIEKEEQLQSLSLELENRHLIISNLESRNQSLLDESLKIKEENKNLNELRSASSISIKDMEKEILSLDDTTEKIEKEKCDRINQEDRLEDIEKNYQELEEKHSVLENEREDTKCEVEELQLIVKECKVKESKQIIEIENLHNKVLDMQKKSFSLQEENLKLIDEKISLVKDFLNFQENHDNTSIEFLKAKVNTLEGENREIGAQLAAYAPAISSLKDCIYSLEKSTCFSMKLGKNGDETVKDASERHDKCYEEPSVDKKERIKLSELQELEARIKAVEKTIIGKNSKLEDATKQIEKLMSNGALSQNGLMTEDIMLDQISDSCSQKIESNYSITKLTRKEDITTQPNLGIIVEKELGVDELASENRFPVPKQEVDKTKIPKRFKSESQKLINLQITVQDLKKKLEISENRLEGKSFGECDRIGWHLGKAEEDIIVLSDLNEILIKSVDKFDDVKNVVESEQAQKVSERIGQLELEVNEIQTIMLKLDGENGEEKIKRKTENIEAKKRTPVRNHLDLRTSNRKKKRSFCGFVYPPATED